MADECTWNPDKHGGKPCPKHGVGAGGYSTTIKGNQWKLKREGSDEEEDISESEYRELRGNEKFDDDGGETFVSEALHEMLQDKYFAQAGQKLLKGKFRDYTFDEADKQYFIDMFQGKADPNKIKTLPFYKWMKEQAKKEKPIDIRDRARIERGAEQFYQAITKGKDDEKYKGNEITLITGLPGAGKSTGKARQYLERAIELDNDIAKGVEEFSKEYLGGLGAVNVHEASKEAWNIVRDRLIEEGWNVVIPFIGDSEKAIAKRMEPFVEAGYSIPNLINVEVDNGTSRQRVFKRALTNERFIDDDIIEAYGNDPTETMKRIVENKGEFEVNGKRYKVNTL